MMLRAFSCCAIQVQRLDLVPGESIFDLLRKKKKKNVVKTKFPFFRLRARNLILSLSPLLNSSVWGSILPETLFLLCY